MTTLEAAKVIIGDRKGERRLRRHLISEVVDYLNRTPTYGLRKLPPGLDAWRNATPEEQDAAAEELLREVIP